MATRKQRRRRAKEHRHEYVWEDEEGNVLDPEEARAATGNGATPKASTPSGKGGRVGRTPQPASWRRTLKRGGIFAPIMLATVMLLNSGKTFAQQLTSTVLVLAVFIPFSYVLDGIMYRSYQKRLAKLGSGGKG